MCCQYPLFAISGYILTPTSVCEHMSPPPSVRSCFAALRQIRSVRRSLPQHALLTLIRALVVSKVDYCCSVLAGVSGHLNKIIRIGCSLSSTPPPDSCSQPGAPNASPASPRPSLVAGPGTDSIPSLHPGIPMDQHRHISLTAFVRQPMWKVVATSALLPP